MSYLAKVPLQFRAGGTPTSHTGANLWKTLRRLKNVAMVNETDRQGERGKRENKYILHPIGFPDVTWDVGLLLAQAVSVGDQQFVEKNLIAGMHHAKDAITHTHTHVHIV